MVEKVDSFVRRLRWKAYHFYKENKENDIKHIKKLWVQNIRNTTTK